MKDKNLFIAILMSSAMLASVSCSKSTGDLSSDIEGIYAGSITRTNSLKSTEESERSVYNGDDFAEVTMLEDKQIQVHCYGEEIDTSFVLDYYMHNDSVLVCLTGDDFEHMYGHMLGAGHMDGNMMGDMKSNETQWMHHLSDEHHPDDEHFGGFDLHMGTFTYSIRMTDEEELYYMKFSGSKEQ
jgi:hypothetical protein